MAEEIVKETTRVERPVSITLISLFLIVGNLLLAWPLFRGTLLQGKGMGESIYMVLVMVASVICGVGLWMMKKWSVYAFAVLAVVIQIALLVLGRWNLFSLLFAAIVVFFGYRNLSKMS